MKKYILWPLLALFILFAGCEQEEIAYYSLKKEAINFASFPQRGDLGMSHEDSPAYLVSTVNMALSGEFVKVDTLMMRVKSQGEIPDTRRGFSLKVDTVLSGKELHIEGLANHFMEAGEYIAEFPIVVHRPQKDSTVRVRLTFDYGQSDFIAGTEERQTFLLDYSDVVNMKVVNMTEDLWNNSYSGYNAMWGMYLNTGFGRWNNAMARFLITFTGITDFTKIPELTELDFMTWTYKPTAFFLEMLDTLNAYKLNSATDPVTYPPFYDETLEPETWITFYIDGVPQ